MALPACVKYVWRRIIAQVSVQRAPANAQGRLRVWQPTGNGCVAACCSNQDPVGINIHGQAVISCHDVLPVAHRCNASTGLQIHRITTRKPKAEIPFSKIVYVEEKSRPVRTTEPILIKRRNRANSGCVTHRKRVGPGPKLHAKTGWV